MKCLLMDIWIQTIIKVQRARAFDRSKIKSMISTTDALIIISINS